MQSHRRSRSKARTAMHPRRWFNLDVIKTWENFVNKQALYLHSLTLRSSDKIRGTSLRVLFLPTIPK